MGLLQILTGSGALALVAIAIAMIRLNEFGIAFWLLWAAGIVAVTAGLWWELTTTDPTVIRMGAGLVAGVAVFVILPMLFRWLDRLKLKAGISPLDTSPGR
jgi:hypothetical protein